MACARRELLLRAHRHRLSREDLEDCYSQATLELIARARQGQVFSNDAHIANALEQRFTSRIQDRRRALGGRSPIEAALAYALPIDDADRGGVGATDPSPSLEELVELRHDLRRTAELAGRLTSDQRLALASQLAGGADRERLCRMLNWSADRHRKLAQRARARLRELLEQELDERER